MNIETLQTSIALVVEDHDAVRRALCDRIKTAFCGLRLREAGSVGEALKIVDMEKVDIVLMDIHLPGMDGVHGTRALLERSPHTSVIMVSIYDDVTHRAAASEAGAAAYVCKRAICTELIPTLAGLMHHRHEHACASDGARENLSK